MKKKPVLINPAVEEKDRNIQIGEPISSSYDYSEQLSLEVDSNVSKFQQLINSIKLNLKNRSKFVEVSGVWKSPAIPFMIVSFLLNILVLLIGGIFSFNQLGPQVSLFYDSINQVRQTEDKSIIFIFPILLLVFFILQIRFLSYIFTKDKRLSIMIAWITTFLNFLLLISISQLAQL